MYLKLPYFHFRPIALSLLLFGTFVFTNQKVHGQTIVDVAAGSEDFSILVEAVQKAGLVGALSADGPFTVFAPTNAAFRQLFRTLRVNGVEDLTAEQLTPILLYHVVDGDILSSRLSDGQTEATLFGNDVTVSRQGDIIEINDARIIMNDIIASNGIIHAINRVLIPAGIVESFTLVNAETNEDIMEISEGGIIDLQALGTSKLNIRANTNPSKTGSVKFGLNGEELPIENLLPYAVFGDNNGDYKEWVPEPGDYTLTGTPFSMPEGAGVEGPTNSISFSVVNNANIVQLALQNPDLSILVQAVQKAGLVDPLSADGPLTVFAPTNGAFQRLFRALGVKGIDDLTAEQLTPILLYHVIDGQILSSGLSDGQTEATLFGNDVTVSKQGDVIKINDSKVTAPDNIATNGVVHVIHEVLIPAGIVESFTLVNAETNEDIMEISEGGIIDLQALGTTKLNIRANTNPSKTGSVKFGLNGEELPIENLLPYAVFGDNNGDYNEWVPEPGDYTLTGTPFSMPEGAGVEGPTNSISFSVVNNANIVQLALQNPNLSILVQAVQKAGLVDPLSADGPLTVFAPTNGAFQRLFRALGVKGIDDLTAEQLTPILLYHVIDGQILSSGLSDGQTEATLFGNDVTVSKQGDVIKINDSKVTAPDNIATNGVVHVIHEVLIPAGIIESYTLVNAETNEDIMEISEGGIIDLQALGTTKLNIRANTNPSKTGSVKFGLNGEELPIENLLPYAVFGDNNGDYNEWVPEPGDYTLTGTPFSMPEGAGVEGPTNSISFSVVNNANIVQLALQNPDLSILVQAVQKAGLVDPLSADGPLTVFAPTNGAFQRLFRALGVKGIDDLTAEQLTPILLYHVIDGQILSSGLSDGQTEATLLGNDVTVSKQGDVIKINDSKVTAPDNIATNGVVHVINEVLIPAGIVESFTLVNAETNEDIMEISEGDTINLAALGTTKLNIRANTNPSKTGSVKFGLNGEELTTENLLPYAAFADNNGDYNEWVPEPGDYTLTGTPFSMAEGAGVEGPTNSISFTIVNNPNIVQLATQTPELSLLVQAVEKAGLVEALSAEGPLTVFAPTNEAFHMLFRNLGVGGLQDLTEAQLTPILLYHVLNGQFLSTDLEAGQIVPTLNGGTSVVLKDESGVTVNGSNVTNADLVATNGVVHVINQVLLPNNIVAVAQSNPDFSILVEAVTKAELVDALSGDGPLTVFAPTNQAFNLLFQDIGVSGVKDLTKEELTPILLYHVIDGGVLSTDLMDDTTAPTLETNEVEINIDADGNIFINESQVTGPNVAASNGVIHAINRVLLPPADGASARFASGGFEVTAYPNPATDRVTINPLKEELADDTNVVIYHSRGDIYYEGQLSNGNGGKLNINVANYPTGVYIIKLQSGSENKTIRLYKQ